MKRKLSLNPAAALLTLALLSLPGTALALQPLSQFLDGAKKANFDAREQEATVEQRSWESNAAMGKLLPSFTARGVYTRNQYQAEFNMGGTPVVITPQNQLDLYLQLDVPIIDLANYYRYSQASHTAKAAELQKSYTSSQVEAGVVRAYYSYIGATALTAAAEQSLASAEENHKYVQNRFELGAATELDVSRAVANVESAKQSLADARLSKELSGRTLETQTGLAPTPAGDAPEVDLTEELPLTEWITNEDTPADKVQREMIEASNKAKTASDMALMPTLSASAQERVTNATAFLGGHSTVYTLQAVLAWRLDYGTYSTARAQASAAEIQKIRAEKTRRTTSDSVFEAWQRVETGIAKARSTRAQAEAAHKASELAAERYKAGTATQLDVTQAQRDAFVADVNRVQADADLSYARAQLRSLAGKSLDHGRPGWTQKTRDQSKQ